MAAPRAPLTAALAFALVPLLFHGVIYALRHVPVGPAPAGLLKLGFVGVAALSYWGIYASLLLMFALTLRPGRVPLITAMVQRLHGQVSEEVLRYTWRVTLAWCCFFMLQLAVSAMLFCFAPLVAWSCFINILDVPMLALMFLGELVCRRLCLRNPPRESLAAILSLVADPMGNRGRDLAHAGAARD